MPSSLTIDFEVAPRGSVTTLTSGYDGFLWDHWHARDARHTGSSGYSDVLTSGHDVGYTTTYSVALPTMSVEHGHFSLESGHFASSWTDDNVVTFMGFRDGVQVAEKTVTLDMAEQFLHFGRHFARIDTFQIKGEGGIGMDDLVVGLPDGGGYRQPADHSADMLMPAHDGFADAGVWHGEPFA